ncbi:substrate-binding domain-containing protein [Streptomyces bobili]
MRPDPGRGSAARGAVVRAGAGGSRLHRAGPAGLTEGARPGPGAAWQRVDCARRALTCTARQPIEAMGRAAVDLLCAQIQGGEVPPGELLFEPELVVRGSTAQAPRG